MSLRAGDILRSRGRWLGGSGAGAEGPATIDKPDSPDLTGSPIDTQQDLDHLYSIRAGEGSKVVRLLERHEKAANDDLRLS